jgi:hypothetical protein
LWSDKGSKRHSDVLWRIVPGAWGTRKWVLGGGWDTTEPVVPWARQSVPGISLRYDDAGRES